ncbi:hypothetical protein [Streptomyces sp. NPDC048438]|uniref:hypothetical protein n=1 Tax=Streptomyces sp. NPDC048438 TaxID=3365551 RepID=UPI0037192D9B
MRSKVRAWAGRQRPPAGLPADLWLLAELIDAEFAALRYFELNGTAHRSHEEQSAAYARWRNVRANPKAPFAPASPNRSWTEYPAEAA